MSYIFKYLRVFADTMLFELGTRVISFIREESLTDRSGPDEFALLPSYMSHPVACFSTTTNVVAFTPGNFVLIFEFIGEVKILSAKELWVMPEAM